MALANGTAVDLVRFGYHVITMDHVGCASELRMQGDDFVTVVTSIHQHIFIEPLIGPL